MSTVTGSFYVQLQPERDDYYRRDRITGVKAARITQKKPSSLVDDAVVIKVGVTIPTDAFENVPVVNIEYAAEDLQGAVAGQALPIEA
jgi:hypothetical protein